MIWFLKTRRVGVLGAVVLVEIALLVVVGSARVPVPSLLQSSTVPVAFAVFLPLLISSAVQYAFEAREPYIERPSVRTIGYFDAGLCLSVSLSLVAFGVFAQFAGADLVLAGTRNGVGYTGLGLLTSRFAGSRAGSFIPAAYAVSLGMFGTSRAGAIQPWQWPLLGSGSAAAALAACVLLAGGLAATIFTSNKPSAN